MAPSSTRTTTMRLPATGRSAARRLTIPITYIEADPHPPGPAVSDEDDGQVDRDAAETFPASDPPANYRACALLPG
jgi:hypothetical protein